MRDVKYKRRDDNFNGDDIGYAFENNGLAERLDDIDVIVAEVCGANDEDDWYWILQMKNGDFSWAKGGCDYTGWDCQSSAEIHDGFFSPQDAVENLKLNEYDNRKNIKECLLKQIKEELPFAILQE